MQRKGKLWMADWRDSSGKRRRKGFSTASQVRQHQNKMQRRESAKKVRASAT